MNTMAISSRRLALTTILPAIIAATVSSGTAWGEAGAAEEAIRVGLFEAIESQQARVKFIPKDATQANVIIENLTPQPLELDLPAAFASVPVLGQIGGGGLGGGGFGGGGLGGGGLGGGGLGGGGQVGGGGFGGGGLGGGGLGGGGGFGGGGGIGGAGGGGGFFRIGPERVRKVSVITVCLEHGKRDPNPKIPYKIVPLEQFSDNPKIRYVCEAIGRGQISQNTAQAAAWHIMDGLSWQELSVKNRVESKYTGNVRWFSPQELRAAVVVVGEATRIAEARKSNESASQKQSDYEG